MPKKVCIIHPMDGTTDFLTDIYNSIEETLIKIVRIETKEDHFLFYESIPEENVILFLGHGTSDSLKGASTIDFEGILMTAAQLSVFTNKDVILFSCRSNQYVKKFYKDANLKHGIGFPNMITDYEEIPFYDHPDRAAGLTTDDIEIFKKTLVSIMKGSLNDFVGLDLNIYQFYNRIILRTNKAILKHYKKNNSDEALGKMLLDLRNGIIIKN